MFMLYFFALIDQTVIWWNLIFHITVKAPNGSYYLIDYIPIKEYNCDCIIVI